MPLKVKSALFCAGLTLGGIIQFVMVYWIQEVVVLQRLLFRQGAGSDFLLHAFEVLRERDDAFVAFRTAANADGLRFSFFRAEDQRVGNLFEFGTADLGTEFVAVLVERRAEPGGAELSEEVLAVVGHFVADRHKSDLLGREPDREIAREVLDEHAAETFHRTKGRAVNHDRAVGLVVGADVGEVEAYGQVVVDLHGAELPFAADDVFDDEVDLRAVEGGFAGFFGEGHAEGLRGFAAGVFGFVPVFGVAGVFVRVGVAQADAHAVVGHAEGAEHGFHEGETADGFRLRLVPRCRRGGRRPG